MDFGYLDIKRQFESIKPMLDTWHKIEIPDGINLIELDVWLEESITERFYRDRLNIVHDNNILWLESTNDLKLFNTWWNVLSKVPTVKMILS